MTISRKLAIALVLAGLCALALPSVAMANFAIHGNYVADDDACAGCHRAHSSISSVTWTTGSGDQSNALLVSSATSMYEFCYACHDGTSQGAATNVEDGLYEGVDSLGVNVDGGDLNGGGFGSAFDPGDWTSTHLYDGSTWGAYGGGSDGNNNPTDWGVGTGMPIKMDCATCHDPHGSSNYRILKASVDENEDVGGYEDSGDPTDPDPDGYVSSVETGWPLGGFRLHKAYDGTGDEPAYVPDYTTAQYAKGRNTLDGADAELTGMSGWCAGCHDNYLEPKDTFTKASSAETYTSSATTYNAGDGAGLRLRHRHPINVELTEYDGQTDLVYDTELPLAHSLDESATPVRDNELGDWIECLTCHRAHGTKATMTGWASEAVMNSNLPQNQLIGSEESALLRMDNRGVCEACHNK